MRLTATRGQIRFWCFALFMALTGACLATPLVVDGRSSVVPLAAHFSVLEDPQSRLGIVDVSAADAAFQPAPPSRSGNELNFGYSASTYWLRLDVQNPSPRAQDWLLEVAFPSLDAITAYAPDGNGHFHTMVTGDLLPFATHPLPHRNFVFPVTLPPLQSTSIYLQVASSGSLTIPAKLWQADAFNHASQDSYVLLSLYYGMLLALGLYNLMLYFSVGDRSYLIYVLYDLGMAVGQLSLNGLGNEYLWPDWPAWGNLALIMGFNCTGFFGALFTRSFLDTRRTVPRRLDHAILLLALAFALLALLSPLAPYRWIAVLTSLAGLGISIAAVWAGLASQRRGYHGARFFLLAWLFLFIGVALMALRNLAILPTTLLTTYGMQIGSALEMLLLSFALANRINRLQQEKEAAQNDALHAHHTALETARKAERELELRVRTRTRALEDANARLSTQEELLRRLAQHDPLTGLANRLLLEDRLQQALLHAERRQGSTVVLLIDLDDFKPINDTHGHAIGDQVLVTVAHRLQAQVRVTDTVARLGGDEFVVVLDDLLEPNDAPKVAQKIVDALAEDIVVGRQALRVTASCGLARWPTDGHTVNELLRAADRAMYIAKSRGRNCYATLGK